MHLDSLIFNMEIKQKDYSHFIDSKPKCNNKSDERKNKEDWLV